MNKRKLNLKKIGTVSMLLILLVTFFPVNLVYAAREMDSASGGGGVKGSCDSTGIAPVGNYARLNIVRSEVGIEIGGALVQIAKMTMDGEWAICVDLNRYTSGGYYTSAGAAGSEFLNAKRALAFLLNTNPDINTEVGLLQFTVAQLYAWGKDDIDIISTAYDSIAEKFGVKLNTFISKIQKAAQISVFLGMVKRTSPVSATLWISGGNQRFISRLCGSKEPLCAIKDGVYYGPDGKKLTGKEEFDKLCNVPVPDENKCEPDQSTGDGECTNTEFKDPSWSCIVGNSDYQDLSITKNSYCSIYCREEVSSNFPLETKTFQAGQYLTVGSGMRNIWGPVNFQGKRECRMYYANGKTEGIDTERFVSDYNNAVSKIPSLYDAWQKEKAKQQAIDSMKTEQTCPTYVLDKVDPKPCGANQHDSGGSCYSSDWGRVELKQADRCDSDRWYSDGKCVKNVEVPNTATKYLSTSYTYKDSYGNTYSENIAGECTKPTSLVIDAKKAYDKAVEKANTILSQMRQCSEMKTTYTLNPEVKFSYKAGAYNWSGQLKSTGGSEDTKISVGSAKGSASGSRNIRGVNSGCYSGNSSCSVAQITCTNGGGCRTTSVNILNVNVTSKSKTTIKTANYSLPDNLFRYTDKVQGNVSTSEPSDLKYTKTYIDLGESTLPLDTYVKTGRYTINLSYSKIGNIVGDTAHFDKTITDMDSDYKCPILIKNDIMGKECEKDPEGCDPVGIDVIYRTIKLGSVSVAFPSIDGDGRKPGANWDSNDGSLVNNYITNNRGVKGEEVYNLTPLYKITLTPAIIKQIRDYNKKVDYGTYDTLTCSVDDSGRASGRKCISSFIHSNVTAGGKSYNFSGYFDSKATCQNITTGNFNSCANK